MEEMERLDEVVNRLPELRENTPASESATKSEIVWTEELTDDIIAARMRDCGVARRFLAARANDIEPGVRAAMGDFFLRRKSFYIWGPVGSGKTHLVAALVREAVRRSPEREVMAEGRLCRVFPSLPRMIYVPDLLREIKSSFDPGSLRTTRQVYESYAEGFCLMMDDIGVEKATDWTLETLSSIVDFRYRENLQTVITSNLGLGELAQRVGDRIASRIAEMCDVVELAGRDRRLPKKD